MKKTICLFFIAAIFASCGGNSGNDNGNAASTDSAANATNTNTANTEANATPAGTTGGTVNADAEKGLDLITKSDCLTCHKVAEKLIGPPYQDVAAKYPNNDATIDMLADKIIKGGAGNWGQVQMTAHPQISKDDAKLMVKYVLSLKQ